MKREEGKEECMRQGEQIIMKTGEKGLRETKACDLVPMDYDIESLTKPFCI